jgi:hypothetical protein
MAKYVSVAYTLWALVSGHSRSDNVATLGGPGSVPVRVQRDLLLELAVLLP